MEAPAEDRCFGTVDLADPEHPKWLATVYTYDPVASPAPPAGHAIYLSDGTAGLRILRYTGPLASTGPLAQ